MLPEISHDVNQRVAYRARRGERTGVVSVSPDRPSAAERPVDGACNADDETTHTARESPARVRLCDQMNVIVLDRKVNDPEILARGNGQRAAANLAFKYYEGTWDRLPDFKKLAPPEVRTGRPAFGSQEIGMRACAAR